MRHDSSSGCGPERRAAEWPRTNVCGSLSMSPVGTFETCHYVEQCPSSRAKRKTFAHSELFAHPKRTFGELLRSAKASSHDRALRPRQNILCHRPEPLAQFRMFEMPAALGRLATH